MSASILYARQLVSRVDHSALTSRNGESGLWSVKVIDALSLRLALPSAAAMASEFRSKVWMRTGRIGKNQNIFAGAVWKKENG